VGLSLGASGLLPGTAGLGFGKGPKTLGKGFAGKEPSKNFESVKRSLPRALYRAHGKAFAEDKKNPRQNVNRKKNPKK
jgi:hypothetical protein